MVEYFKEGISERNKIRSYQFNTEKNLEYIAQEVDAEQKDTELRNHLKHLESFLVDQIKSDTLFYQLHLVTKQLLCEISEDYFYILRVATIPYMLDNYNLLLRNYKLYKPYSLAFQSSSKKNKLSNLSALE